MRRESLVRTVLARTPAVHVRTGLKFRDWISKRRTSRQRSYARGGRGGTLTTSLIQRVERGRRNSARENLDSASSLEVWEVARRDLHPVD